MVKKDSLISSRGFWGCLGLVLILLLPAAVAGASSKTGPYPPTRRMIFRDDELLMIVGDPGAHKAEFISAAPDDASLDKWNKDRIWHDYDRDYYFCDSSCRTTPVRRLCRGRFTRFDIEQAVSCFPGSDGKYIHLELWDLDQKIPYAGSKSFRCYNLAEPQSNVGLYEDFAVAAADLDEVADAEGHYHDEVIVVRYDRNARHQKKVFVEILALTPKTDGGVDFATLCEVELDPPPVVIEDGKPLCSVALAVGDFNGDSHFGLAVFRAAQASSSRGLAGNLISFERTADGLQAKVGSTWRGTTPGGMVPLAMAATAVDLDGDGTDEIGLATADYLRVITVDDNGRLHRKIKRSHSGDTSGEIRILPGTFFRDGQGLGYARQLVCCGYAGGGTPWSYVIGFKKVEADDGEEKFSLTHYKSFYYKLPFGAPDAAYITYLDLAVGNFAGVNADGQSDAPVDGYVFTFMFWSDDRDTTYRQVVLQEMNGDQTVIWQGKGDDYKPMPTALLALDSDGDSLFLGGPPIHVAISDYHFLEYIIQEPPKHVDYLPVDADDPTGDWEVVNVSAYDDFYTDLKDSQETVLETRTTVSSSHSYGGGFGLDVKGSIPPIANVGISTELKGKINYLYRSREAEINASYQTFRTAYEGKTAHDDLLVGSVGGLDIWSYPIIGYLNPDQDKPPYGFLEVLLPAASTSFRVAGRSADWYQPWHQNGNVLTYPPIVETDSGSDSEVGTRPAFLADLGSYIRPDGSRTKVPLNELATYTVTGITQSQSISWSVATSDEKRISYEHTLGENEEVVSSIGSEADGVEVEVNFNQSNSWGGAKVSSTVISAGKGITISMHSHNDSRYDYGFMPAVYMTAGTGALKVAYAVDPLYAADGAAWWRRHYGRRPDPGLNLPNRFTWHEPEGEHREEYWILNDHSDRMNMRGFLLRRDDPDPVSGLHPALTGPPVDGEKVRLCARVYNFALSDPVEDLKVRFEVVQLDERDEEIGERELVGDTRVSLGTLSDGFNDSMKEVYVVWDTAGKASENGYRFYVTLDPDNEITDELHEWKDADGQRILHGNNEGFWPWSSGVHVVRAPEQILLQNAASERWLAVADIELEKEGEYLSAGPIPVTAGEEYRIRARIVTNAAYHPRFVNVCFYEEDFSGRRRLLAMRRISVIGAGSPVWCRWRPTQVGLSRLTAEVVGSHVPVVDNDHGLTLAVHPARPQSSWQSSVFNSLLPF
ncbi:MAG: hypothetical protein GXO34_06605 [Deltaproteobacteria bacterium]|nr:hypothetical protein [Deltaproteobacteria bacterium]